MAKLQEEVERLRSIRQSERVTDEWSCALPSLICTVQPSMATTEVGPVSDLHHAKGSNLKDTEEWQKVTEWNSKRSLCLSIQPPLMMNCEALGMVKERCEKVEEDVSVQVLPQG